MTKILLVEDDKSLREIYGVRLFAEGYDVVSAGDGEQALAVAIKERPALIITDVMMPKISGFDMLDILRSTTETKEIKVIVMTALGSDDNRERGERLGADRYLVKSQVGIEDVIREVHSLLGDQPAPQASMQMPSQQPPASATMMSATGAPNPMGARPNPQSAFAPPSSTMGASDIPTRRPRIIQPISNPAGQVDIQALVDKELAKEGKSANTVAEQRQVVNSQLNDFSNLPAPAASPTAASTPAAASTQPPAAPAPDSTLPRPVAPTAPAPTQQAQTPAPQPQQQPQAPQAMPSQMSPQPVSTPPAPTAQTPPVQQPPAAPAV